VYQNGAIITSNTQPNCAAASLSYKSYDFYIGSATTASANLTSSYQYTSSDVRYCWRFYPCTGTTSPNYICKISAANMPCYPPPNPPPPPPLPPLPPLPPAPPSCAPASNATFFCTFNTSTCYWYGATQTNQATAEGVCQGLSGHLTSYADHYEQVRRSAARPRRASHP
jgi:hypothetical protein